MRMTTHGLVVSSVLISVLSACQAAQIEPPLPLCDEASEYIHECTGISDPAFDTYCEDTEATQVLDTPCEVLQEAVSALGELKADGWVEEVSYGCHAFGFGCPPSEPCSAPELSYWAEQDLIEISEPTSVSGPYDVQWRVNAIAEIFAWEGDPRGLFATVYRLITNRAVQSVEDGDYEYPQWGEALITEFGRRYLGNLHGHLTGGEISGPWAKYYQLAQDCDVGRGRTLGVAIAVHLMVDLPYTLHQIGSRSEQRDDFVLFGDILLEVFPDLIRDVGSDYDTDVTGLLNGFFIGEWVDSVTSDGTTTEFIYQGVRMKAWRDSQNLWSFPEWLVSRDIYTAWGLAEVALATLDAQGAL